MGMIAYLDHVAITVKNLNRSIEFYTKLGFSVVRRAETTTLNIAFVGSGLARLELFELRKEAAKEVSQPKDNEIGVKHIAFHVDDIEGVVEELKKKGVEFTTEIMKTGRRTSIFFKDPDGTILQLIQG